MESFDWSNHHRHHALEDNMSLFMPVISNVNVLSGINNNIGGNIISKDLLNPITPDDQHVRRKTDMFIDNSAILFDHHHHPQNRPIFDSRASNLCGVGLGDLKPGIMTNTGSFGSLECLITASNSHNTDTTTSIEEDGISILFSDNCKNLLMDSNQKKQAGECMETDSRTTSYPREHVDSHNHVRDDPISRKRSSSSSDQNLQIKSTPLTSHQNLNCSLSHKYMSNHSTTSTTHVTSNNNGNAFQLISSSDTEHHHQSHKKPRSSDKTKPPIIESSLNISFQHPSSSASSGDHHEPDTEAIAQMKEMIYRAAAFRPVDFGPEAMEKPKRKNVKISNDPQTVAARQRREKISERIRVLQRLVPGGSKMDTASMLDEAANYLRFLRSWVKALESFGVQQIDHLSMINNLSSSSAINADYLNSLGFVNDAFSMHHHQQPQFAILNHSSFHPSTS